MQLENTGATPAIGGALIDEVEGNDTAATANDASASWRAVQYLARTNASIDTAGDIDVYRYHLMRGDLITLNMASTSTVDLRVNLLNASGTTIASEDGSSSGPGLNSPVYAFRIPSTGTYYVQVQATTGTGAYNADVYLSTTTNPPQPSPPTVDDYSLTLTAGQSVSALVQRLGSSGLVDIRLTDPTGTALAVSTATGNLARFGTMLRSRRECTTCKFRARITFPTVLS